MQDYSLNLLIMSTCVHVTIAHLQDSENETVYTVYFTQGLLTSVKKMIKAQSVWCGRTEVPRDWIHYFPQCQTISGTQSMERACFIWETGKLYIVLLWYVWVCYKCCTVESGWGTADSDRSLTFCSVIPHLRNYEIYILGKIWLQWNKCHWAFCHRQSQKFIVGLSQSRIF